MAKPLLLKTQKNQVLELIKKTVFDPTKFKWEVIGTQYAMTNMEKLIYNGTDFHFLFSYDEHGWRIDYSPGQDSPYKQELLPSWGEVLLTCAAWLYSLQDEVEAPDLWATIADEKAIVVAASGEEIENTPFTPVEQKQISAQLNEIKEYLGKTQEFNEQQAEFVNKRFDYLADAATRMRRKDWLNLAVGVITTVVIQLMFQPNVIHEIYQFIGKIFKPLLEGVLPLQ